MYKKNKFIIFFILAVIYIGLMNVNIFAKKLKQDTLDCFIKENIDKYELKETQEFQEFAAAGSYYDFIYTADGGNIYFDSSSKKIVDSDESVKKVVIPKTINNVLVTEISAGAFANCNNLTDIKIPDSIVKIGENAFFNCISLKSIKIPESVKTINYAAFSNCESLSDVEISNGINKIDFNAFIGCKKLKNIKIPESVTYIGDCIFLECTNLTNIEVEKTNKYYTSVDGVLFNKEKTNIIVYPSNKPFTYYLIPNTVIEISTGAFSFCKNLIKIEMPKGLKIINSGVFQYCSNLKSIKMHDNIEVIKGYAFMCCTSLTDIKIPKNITEIQDAAFSSCISLKYIEIPDSVIKINEYAFEYCINLEKLKIPDSVKEISARAFKVYDLNKLIIYCKSGSYAEKYAKDNDINYRNYY